MTMETKQLHALSKIYKEAVYGGAKKEAPKDTRLTVTAADKKANTKAYQNYKAGNKAYKAADHLKNESLSNWREDLKEVPNYEQIPIDAKDRNKKIEEKNVKNKIKINPEMKEETQVDEGVYEKQKTKEVMGALKKRDLKKDVKKKIAADIVKKKGDTSKSDDRYAYEDHVWDKVADMLTELGKLNDVSYRVEGYQRNPEEGERKERAAAKKGEAIRGQARRKMPPRGNKDREEFERWYAANVR